MPLGVAGAGFRAFPLRSLAALFLLVPFVIYPQIDLTVSGWFYRPDLGFYLKNAPFCVFILKGMPPILIGLAVGILLLGIAGRFLKKTFWGVTDRIAAYVVSTLILGPGIVVNLLLKDHWGRARPGQISEFGGVAHYTPPGMIVDQCVDNCSFPSGHGSLGFWVTALAFLAPPRWRKAALTAALAFGVVVGVVRIAQGGHFLSDVVFSAILVIAINIWFKRLLLPENPSL